MKPRAKSRPDLILGVAIPLFLSAIYVGVFHREMPLHLLVLTLLFPVLLLVCLCLPTTWRASKQGRKSYALPVMGVLTVLLQLGFVSVLMAFSAAMTSIMPPVPKLGLPELLTGEYRYAFVILWSAVILLAAGFMRLRDQDKAPTVCALFENVLPEGKFPPWLMLTIDLAFRFACVFALSALFGYLTIAWVNMIAGAKVVPIAASYQQEHLLIFMMIMVLLSQKIINKKFNTLAGKTKNAGVWFALCLAATVLVILLLHIFLIIMVGKDHFLKRLFIYPAHPYTEISSLISYGTILVTFCIGLLRLLAGAVATLAKGHRIAVMIVVNSLLPLLLTGAYLCPHYAPVLNELMTDTTFQTHNFLLATPLFCIFMMVFKQSGWWLFAGETDGTHTKANPKLKAIKHAMRLAILYVCIALTGMRVIAVINLYCVYAGLFAIGCAVGAVLLLSRRPE